MLVTILGFGCNWWRRFGRDPNDRFRYTKHAAFYNSTGVQCGRKVRRHWAIPGLIRFNGSGSLMRHDLHRSVGRTYVCTEPIFALGGNRVVFERAVSGAVNPDYFLVVLSAERFGAVNLWQPAWKSGGAHAIAASQLRDKQETMLLMRVGDWVSTNLGRWSLSPVHDLASGVALQLAER